MIYLIYILMLAFAFRVLADIKASGPSCWGGTHYFWYSKKQGEFSLNTPMYWMDFNGGTINMQKSHLNQVRLCSGEILDYTYATLEKINTCKWDDMIFLGTGRIHSVNGVVQR